MTCHLEAQWPHVFALEDSASRKEFAEALKLDLEKTTDPNVSAMAGTICCIAGGILIYPFSYIASGLTCLLTGNVFCDATRLTENRNIVTQDREQIDPLVARVWDRALTDTSCVTPHLNTRLINALINELRQM